MRGHTPGKVSASGSDTSEAEDAPEERRYRVRVCLQRFFSDERARCYVWVSSSRRVRWLARRLQRMFELPPDLALLSCGHLLPSGEPLALLAPDDPVEVIQIAEGRYVDEAEPGSGDELDSASEPAPAKRPRHAAPLHDTASSAAPDTLIEMKRRALLLLEDVSGVATAASSSPVSPPPASQPRGRRRRVRRRRVARAASLETTPPARAAARVAAPHAAPHAAPQAAPLVRRNVGAATRSPRAVRSLADGALDPGER